MAKPNHRLLAQERELKEVASEIHMGLYTLRQIYKSTAEFDKCYAEGMFIKSNPAAFPHVLHFLLYNLDAAEFSSRFLWPLHDKIQEKEFRQSCVKYLNDLNKKHKLELEEVGHYIVVVPGGLKFMKVLLSLIKLLQTETLNLHNCSDYLNLPPEKVFDDELRIQMQNQYSAMQQAHQTVSQAAQKELKKYRKKTEMLNYHIRGMESHIKAVPETSVGQALQSDVENICGKMQQVIEIVSDLEKVCETGVDHQSDPFERIHLSAAINRIVEHHKWMMSPAEEYTHRVQCMSILDLASRVIAEINTNPIRVARVDPLQVVNQNHELELLLRNFASAEGDLRLIQCRIQLDEERHHQHAILHPKQPVIFPERDYKLAEMEPYDLAAFYAELQRRPESLLPPNFRLALQDALLDATVTSPTATGKSLDMTLERSLSLMSMTARKNHLSTTVKKPRSKAMSVLKTISRSNNKRSKVNMDALKELARNGFNESMLDASTITWKKKSVNVSVSETITRSNTGHTRISGIFSESMMSKFNSTAIFNSTTNEQAQQLVLGDITNKEAVITITTTTTTTVPKETAEERSLMKQFKDIGVDESQENILDCSDSVLIN